MLHGPGQHLGHGGVLGIQPPGRGRLPLDGLQPRRGLPGHPRRPPGQGDLGRVLLPGPGQQPGAVAAQRLQHRVPPPAIGPFPRRDQQRAVHQMQHHLPGARPGDRLGRLQRERPREHRHRPEHPPLILAQQPVAPLHRRRQRPVPPRRQPVPARQQAEPVIEPVRQLRHSQRLHPRRRQLDRQRHPVQPRHQPRHHRPGLARPARNCASAWRARSANSATASDPPASPGSPPGRVSGPSRYRASPATASGSRLVASTRTSSQAASSPAHSSAAAPITCSQLSSTSSSCRRARTRASTSAAGTPGCSRTPSAAATTPRTCAGSLHRGQLRQPRPVGEPARHRPGHLAGQPGLAHPARPGHRHQPVLLQQARDLAHRPVPADEARQRGREAMHATGRGDRRRLPHARTITRAAATVQPSRTRSRRSRASATQMTRSPPAGRPAPPLPLSTRPHVRPPPAGPRPGTRARPCLKTPVNE